MSGTHTSSIRLLLIALLGVGIIGYGLFSFRHVFQGPEIVVESPTEGQIVSGLVEVKGYAPNTTHTSIDGKTLYVDESGHFDEKVLLSAGPATITLYAKDRFGREVTRSIQVYAQ
jgi:hypothetical protein